MCMDPSRLLWPSQQWSTRSHWNLRPWGYRRTAMLYGLGQTGGSRFQRSYLRYLPRHVPKTQIMYNKGPVDKVARKSFLW